MAKNDNIKDFFTELKAALVNKGITNAVYPY